ITLCSNHTTGFQWSEARIGDETLVEEVSHEFVPPNGQTVGAAGKEVWTFKALKEGRTTISMEYSQPWEGGTKAEWTFELTVEVE
ncbi:MAG: protease inhibitor I42 family protein, partial [Promethearchaeota archaeon]